MSNQKASLFESLNALVQPIDGGQEKAAAEKAAETPTPDDPGGYQGPTTHATKDVDNRGQEASEGSRGSEHTSDVNKDQGAPGVNQAADAKPGQQDDVQLNIGTNQSATGEDPGTEDDYKGGKDDPGSTHPARTDNDSLDGHKYASLSLTDALAAHTKLANDILADLATGQGKNLTEGKPAEKEAAATPAPSADTSEVTETSQLIEKAAAAVAQGESEEVDADMQAGYQLAAQLGLEKQAAQELVASEVSAVLEDARLDAELLGNYLTSYKQAADMADGEDHDAAGDETSGASDAEGAGGETPGESEAAPAAGGDPAGGGEEDLGGLGDAIGGGEDPAGMMGGAPVGEDPMGGGDPLGGASQEEILMQLVAALEELGIPLEELAGAGAPAEDPLAGGGLEGGGLEGAPAGPDANMPPMEGGAPAPTAMTEGMKLASAAQDFKRRGMYEQKAAEDGSPERKLRNHLKSYVQEMMAYGK